MSLLHRLDSLMHNWVFNPLFMWIQRWFHWNRFQLITPARYTVMVSRLLVAFVALYKVVVPEESSTQPWLLWTVIALQAAMISTGLKTAREEKPLLEAASGHFERTGRATAWALVRSKKGEGVRMMSNIAIICFLSLLILELVQDHRVSALGTILLVEALLRAVESHLWSTDDINPGDREHIFDPDPKTANNRS